MKLYGFSWIGIFLSTLISWQKITISVYLSLFAFLSFLFLSLLIPSFFFFSYSLLFCSALFCFVVLLQYFWKPLIDIRIRFTFSFLPSFVSFFLSFHNFSSLISYTVLSLFNLLITMFFFSIYLFISSSFTSLLLLLYLIISHFSYFHLILSLLRIISIFWELNWKKWILLFFCIANFVFLEMKICGRCYLGPLKITKFPSLDHFEGRKWLILSLIRAKEVFWLEYLNGATGEVKY